MKGVGQLSFQSCFTLMLFFLVALDSRFRGNDG